MSGHGGLSEAQEALFERVRALGHEVLAPLADEGEPGRVNRPLVRALGDEQLLARVLPSEGEGSAVELCLLREGLAHGCTEAETALALQGLGGYPILRNARPEVREAWVSRLAAGEAVAAFALSEPDAGSDAAALSLRADRDGDGFRLTGTKTWISNAPEADVYTVFARTTEGAGARGVTAFAVPRESEGVSGEALRLLSPHPIGRLELDGVRLGDEQVLGEVDKGFRVAMETLDLFRPSVGAFAVGMAQAALDAAVAHAAAREAFGKPLSELQAVGHQLAEVATRVQASRLLVYDAAAAYDAGVRPVRQAAAMAKLFATETAQQAVDVAIQVHGARALEEGHLLEHLYREVRAPRIYEGASEVQREIIARELFKETA
ncbi:MAG TPA: acyl-CoA dehydrogenase family protein [Gaiellaceae bacterium]|jgi:alkylation response protein AidB-like acyl-CoA dehydrogenase|nr:acyl-CoA dehydrogenase family protein [Gaiellaceae bacterium]